MFDMTSFLNSIGKTCHYRIFWNTPYDKGNLARNGISDLGALSINSVGFKLFGKGTEYGAILNKARTITYRRIDLRTGIVETIQYPNRHCGWVDNFAEQFANELTLAYPNLRRVL